MSRVVVIGGGMCGMLTGILLAKDGHEVTILERDDGPPPRDADDAWVQWSRRGVNQFRLLHYLQPRFRELADDHIPELVPELERYGARRFNFIDALPVAVTGGLRPEDARFDTLTGRRPVIEAAVAQVAASTPGLTIRRGSAVASFVTGTPTAAGVPRVVGVRTDGGEELSADLVIDAAGRRSTLPDRLVEIGARAVEEQVEDCGFVYYGRHFRSTDGSLPAMRGSLHSMLGTISVLTLPADNGTWGVGLVTSSRDKEMRALKDPERWDAVLGAFPSVAHWSDGEPLTGVDVMAGIADRHRTFVIDGEPVATGVVAVADAWACTNPSVGRGITIGFLHAVALRDTVRDVGLDDPHAFALAFHDATQEHAEPWFAGTLELDRARLDEVHALLETGEYVNDEPGHKIRQAMAAGAQRDPDLLRAMATIGSMLARPDEVIGDAALFEKILGFAGEAPIVDAPSREELVALVA